MIEGEMPEDVNKAPDPANVIAYHVGDRLYMIDSGVGHKMRQSIEQLLAQIGSVQTFTLLHSHSHLDHVCNNDLIQQVSAKEKHHCLSKDGWSGLDTQAYFADHFMELEKYYDPFTGYQAHQLNFRLAGILRDGLAMVVGRKRAWKLLMTTVIRRFRPINISRETLEPYEALPKQILRIGETTWDGWVFGDADIWVLEEPGHSPDEVLFYIAEHRLLHMGDATFPLIPTWPDSNSAILHEAQRKCIAMANAGQVSLLTDGHHHQVYRGQDEIASFLTTILSDHEQFRGVLDEILREEEGLSISEIYARLRGRPEPVIQLEHPASSSSCGRLYCQRLRNR